MQEVWKGIEYAHHHGVIHRDLKPANILITEAIHGPIPKIIDFGIAKDLTQADIRMGAAEQKLVGTLDYMSPEQLGGDAAEVDAHSDIYALGVVLHEVLIDQIPLAEEMRSTETLDARLSCIRGTVPAPMSSTLKTLESSGDLSKNRSTSFDVLTQQVTCELDRIVSRMLAKSTDERYATIQQVSEDVDRFLDSRALNTKRPITTARNRHGWAYYLALLGFGFLLFRVLSAAYTSEMAGEDRDGGMNGIQTTELDASIPTLSQPAGTSAELFSDQKSTVDSLHQAGSALSLSANAEMVVKEKKHFYYLIHDMMPVKAFELSKSWGSNSELRILRQELVLEAKFSRLRPNVEIEICDWNNEPFAWQKLSVTNGVIELPLGDVFIEPLSKRFKPSIRMRVSCPGYVPREMILNAIRLETIVDQLQLVKKTASTPDKMVLVTGISGLGGMQDKSQGVDASMTPNWFCIDQYEVSNQDYLEFVQDGGYENPEFWSTFRFIFEGAEQPFSEAMKRFIDSTGRLGPATWISGSYPPGMARYPVSGVSVFEAAAYARYRNKQLPTVEQWRRAASGFVRFAMTARSNFASNGLAECGAHSGISTYNIRDLGGNVREWCSTDDELGNSYVLGGSWQSPRHALNMNILVSQWDRNEVNGFRCCEPYRMTSQNKTKSQSVRDTFRPPAQPDPGFALLTLEKLKNLHTDSTAKPLNARGNGIQNATLARLGISYSIAQLDSAFDKSRFNLHLFAPEGCKEPMGCVVVLPGRFGFSGLTETETGLAFAHQLSQLEATDLLTQHRVLVCIPDFGKMVKTGSKNRSKNPRIAVDSERPNIAGKILANSIRALEYLTSRSDIDTDRMILLALGTNGEDALRLLALDPRLNYAALVGTGYEKFSKLGLRMQNSPDSNPGSYQYAPHVKQPVLMINGSLDLKYPDVSRQTPLFKELGSSVKAKITIGQDLLEEPQHFRSVYLEFVEWFKKQEKIQGSPGS
ncbi:MAG TPA: hypothetical protein DEF45_06745 [Rhodopirellula sp.]|nr:hypothetical protein [Rhodopirellula sp.]